MADSGIVGSWQVAVTIPGVPQTITNLATINADGTMVVAFGTPVAAAPGQDHKLEFYSAALGSWRALDDGSIAMTFVSLGTDETGKPVGTHAVSARVTLAADQQSWSGPFRISMASAVGTALGSVDGTTNATRIAAEPPAS
jgi:hypothetical protein